MKRLLLAVAAVAAFASAVIAAEVQTYWVATDGSDDPETVGSEEAPFLTLTNAVAHANAGDTVRVKEGTHVCPATTKLEKGITIIGAGRDKTVLDFNGKRRGFEITASATVSSLVISNCYHNEWKGYACGVKMSVGTVTNCLFTECHMHAATTYGGAVYISGGKVVDCEITRCYIGVPSNSTNDGLGSDGMAIYMANGTVTGCDIHHCDGGYSHSSLNSGSSVVYVGGANAVLQNSKIHDNTRPSSPGVKLYRGTVRNCLFYGNKATLNTGSAAINLVASNFSRSLYDCTVYGNVTSGDTTGYSGIYRVSGAATVKNCIFYGNGPSTSSAGSCCVSAGITFENNVIDNALDSYPSNKVGDPKFMDAAANDFHIASRASPAYGYGVPISGITADIEGFMRDASAPTCGCYEYDPSKEAFGVDVKLGAESIRAGDATTAEAVLTGAEESEVSVSWLLDGETLAGETGLIVELKGLAPGRHTVDVRVTRTADGKTVQPEAPAVLAVRPTVCYVNETGSGTYPYATPLTATRSINEAVATVWNSADTTGVVQVASGRYALISGIALQSPIRILGEGPETTFVTNFPGRAFTLKHVAAEVSGLTVAFGKFGFDVSAGRVRDCRAQDLRNEDVRTSGTGFKISGSGFVEGCVATNCKATAIYSFGTGFHLTGGTATNCTAIGCNGQDTLEQSQSFGSGVYMEGGTLTHSSVISCGKESRASGAGIAVRTSGRVMWCCFVGNRSNGGNAVDLAGATVRNCLFAENTGVHTNIVISGGTVDSSTFTTNVGAKVAVAVKDNAKVYNSILAGNGGTYYFASSTFSHCCSPALEDGVDGNTSQDPKLKRDHTLQGSSPCVNAGDNTRWDGYVNPKDLSGSSRIRYGIVDMGCFEALCPGLMLLVR